MGILGRREGWSQVGSFERREDRMDSHQEEDSGERERERGGGGESQQVSMGTQVRLTLTTTISVVSTGFATSMWRN